MDFSEHFKPDKNVIRVKRKPEICPQCASTEIAYYQYGEPCFTEILKKEIKEGKRLSNFLSGQPFTLLLNVS